MGDQHPGSGVTMALDSKSLPLGCGNYRDNRDNRNKRYKWTEASAPGCCQKSQGGTTMSVNYTAIRKVTGRGSSPDLSAFSAMVHIISGASHKLFLRLRIGDGAFPKAPKCARKRHFGPCN